MGNVLAGKVRRPSHAACIRVPRQGQPNRSTRGWEGPVTLRLRFASEPPDGQPNLSTGSRHQLRTPPCPQRDNWTGVRLVYLTARAMYSKERAGGRESMLANMTAEGNERRPGERSNNVKREGRARRGGLNSRPGAAGPRPEAPGASGSGAPPLACCPASHDKELVRSQASGCQPEKRSRTESITITIPDDDLLQHRCRLSLVAAESKFLLSNRHMI